VPYNDIRFNLITQIIMSSVVNSEKIPAGTNSATASECWLEIELSWFQGKPQEILVDELFDRLLPLWHRPVVGRCGLVFCVGWMFDSVLGWNGEAEQLIPCCNGPSYERWSYARLAGLLAAIRQKAKACGLGKLHLGLLLHGCPDFSVAESYNPALRKGRTDRRDDQYGYNIKGRWFKEHPEVRDDRFDHHFSFANPVHVPEEERICRKPDNFGAYFAEKMAAMTSATGFDAVVLRDCVLTSNAGDYRGAYSMPPELHKIWTDSIVAMLAAAKGARPGLLLIGYSGYMTQLTTLRATGFDLEAVAMSGHLDLWITQTWASAFQDYWRSDTLGYLPALVNCLTDQAMLSNSRTGHLFLVETFDAWEPFESLRDFPDKLDWLVQALGRAGVHRPDGGFSRSVGYYMSWMSKRTELISTQDVQHLVASTNHLATGLAEDPRPLGPCLVHDRDSQLALLAQPTAHCRGEIADQWLGQLARHGTSVLSTTRAEWLERVSVGGLIYPCPAAPSNAALSGLHKHLKKGTPVLLMGQADAMALEMRSLLGIAVEGTPTTARFASAAKVVESWRERIGCEDVILNQRRRSLAEGAEWSSLLTGLGGPILARHRQLPCWIWEPPHWAGQWELTCENLYSLQAWWLIAEATGDGWGLPKWKNQRPMRPVCVVGWRTASNRVEVLLGNLENGMVGDSAHAAVGQLSGKGWEAILGAKHVVLKPRDPDTEVLLAGHERAILSIPGDTL
jgi:hypothetical protein